MRTRLVLDSAGFDVLDLAGSQRLWALIERVVSGDGEICCAAVTLAEVCRGRARTRRVEAALARVHGGHRVRVIPTDERLAKLVGAILHETDSGSEMIADAHVVAVCTGADTAAVVTSDPDDIARLATAVRGVRILTRRP